MVCDWSVLTAHGMHRIFNDVLVPDIGYSDFTFFLIPPTQRPDNLETL